MMRSAVTESHLEKCEQVFTKAWRDEDFLAANNIAMALARELFEGDAALARTIMWERFYSRLPGKGVPYQSFDFECVDYELYRIKGIESLLRGPEPDLDHAHGRYITFLGAAQFFGRHQQRPPHVLVSQALGIPCVNLAVSGAGPKNFFSEESLRIANGGVAVVLQMLSGRSVGCDEYPGGRKTFRTNTREKVLRLTLLKEIWQESQEEAIRLTKKWQCIYVASITRLLGLIQVPTVLAWISARAPNEWSIDQMKETGDFGKFPHLIDEGVVRQISSHCAEFVSVTRDEGLPHDFVSRFSGEKCPIFMPDGRLAWQNQYYPSSIAGQRLSLDIEAALRAMRIGS